MNNKGTCHIFLQEYDQAIKVFLSSLEINNKNHETYLFLAKCYFFQNKNKKGVLILKDALNNCEKKEEILFLLASTLHKLGEPEDARKFYLELIQIKKTDAIFNRLALCCEELFNYDEAFMYYEEGLKLNNNNTDLLCNLGSLHRSLGNFEKGKELYYSAKKINPNLSEVHRYISVITKYKSKNDEHLQEMLNVIGSAEFKKNQKQHHSIYFALSKAYEDLKDFKTSASYLTIGNKLRKSVMKKKYNIENIKKHFSMLQNIFSYFSSQANNTFGSDSNKPIFIVGMPRSGTTLVEQIISSHAKVESGGELSYIGNIIYDYFPDNDPDTFVEKVKAELPNHLPEMASIYLKKISNISNILQVTDKLPHNFVFIGFIKMMFPQAKIIHCNRDAKSTCFSIFKNYFPDESLWFAYDENDLVEYYALYKELMIFWKKIYGETIYDISYENLVTNQKVETEKVLQFLSLDWDDNCLQFNKNVSKVATLSTTQVRQPMYSTSVQQWKDFETYFPKLFNQLN
jgi:tetratricopeptide (TPR) repeat protein